MEAKDKKLVDTICLNLCDEGRCQRYPNLSMSCAHFRPLLRAYKAGIREVVRWLLEEDDLPLKDEYKYPPKTIAQVRAKLKDWGIDEPI